MPAPSLPQLFRGAWVRPLPARANQAFRSLDDNLAHQVGPLWNARETLAAIRLGGAGLHSGHTRHPGVTGWSAAMSAVRPRHADTVAALPGVTALLSVRETRVVAGCNAALGKREPKLVRRARACANHAAALAVGLAQLAQRQTDLVDSVTPRVAELAATVDTLFVGFTAVRATLFGLRADFTKLVEHALGSFDWPRGAATTDRQTTFEAVAVGGAFERATVDIGFTGLESGLAPCRREARAVRATSERTTLCSE